MSERFAVCNGLKVTTCMFLFTSGSVAVPASVYFQPDNFSFILSVALWRLHWKSLPACGVEHDASFFILGR